MLQIFFPDKHAMNDVNTEQFIAEFLGTLKISFQLVLIITVIALKFCKELFFWFIGNF